MVAEVTSIPDEDEALSPTVEKVYETTTDEAKMILVNEGNQLTRYREMSPKEFEEYIKDTIMSSPKSGSHNNSGKPEHRKTNETQGKWIYKGKHNSTDQSEPRSPSPDGSYAGTRGSNEYDTRHAGLYGVRSFGQDQPTNNIDAFPTSALGSRNTTSIQLMERNLSRATAKR
jgi:hypothetical protein